MEKSQKRFFGNVLIGLGIIVFLIGGYRRELVALVTVGAGIIIWGAVLRRKNKPTPKEPGRPNDDAV